jgi:hypothetical protein
MVTYFRDFQEINDPGLWGGHPARLWDGTGGDTHPTRKFGMFFYLEVP